MPRLCTAINQDRRCQNRAMPGQPFCWVHHPHPYTPRPCQYFTLRGERCQAQTLRGQDHCFAHSPRNRRALHPAVPLVPRTRRQKLQARWFVFKNMPEAERALLETLPLQ